MSLVKIYEDIKFFVDDSACKTEKISHDKYRDSENVVEWLNILTSHELIRHSMCSCTDTHPQNPTYTHTVIDMMPKLQTQSKTYK